jgi:hypothetical protein
MLWGALGLGGVGIVFALIGLLVPNVVHIF